MLSPFNTTSMAASGIELTTPGLTQWAWRKGGHAFTLSVMGDPTVWFFYLFISRATRNRIIKNFISSAKARSPTFSSGLHFGNVRRPVFQSKRIHIKRSNANRKKCPPDWWAGRPGLEAVEVNKVTGSHGIFLWRRNQGAKMKLF